MNDGEGPETFFARQARQKAKGINGNGMGMPLTIAATTWPTPTARDWRSDSGQQSNEELYGTKGKPLPRVAMQWQTPLVADAGEKVTLASHQESLLRQAGQWATPSVADTTGGRLSRSGDRSDEPLLKGQANALVSSLPDPVIYTVGGIPSKERRSLNPLFVEWLMGWPPGWTLLAWTDFACSEMALSAWKQRMRFALSQLALPQAAPPAQLGLFA